MSTSAALCPDCGRPGLFLGGGVWSCWTCTVSYAGEWGSGEDACRCDCDICRTMCEWIDDEDRQPFGDVVEALGMRLPGGFDLGRPPVRHGATWTLALLYTRDGIRLTWIEGRALRPAPAGARLVEVSG